MPPNPNESLVSEAVARGDALKQERNPWLTHWQLIGEFIHGRKQTFTSEHEVGAFLNQELYNSAATRFAQVSSSALLSMLWPDSTRRFKLTPPKGLKETKAVKEFYENITQVMLDKMDDPNTGLGTALSEYMLEQVTFQTSGIEIVSDRGTDIRYTPWGVDAMVVDEGANGLVDTVYLYVSYTVGRIVKEYGLEKVSSRIKGLWDQNKRNDKEKLLIAIEPRMVFDAKAKGNRAMPWRALHIELGGSKHLLQETGFNELPVKVTRFIKLPNEKYGRGFASSALPDVMQLNAVTESYMIATEKQLDPPLAVLDDGRLGSGTINTSAGQVNVFNVTGRVTNDSPVQPLFTVGDLRQTVDLMEKLTQSIADHFAIDRLLNFNNEAQMTLGEAQIRLQLQNATLRTIFTRQISELFTPLVERTFNILLERGLFGVVDGSLQQQLDPNKPVIPSEVAELMVSGENVYNIEYTTPASRIMQSEEAEGITRTIEFTGMAMQIKPDAGDNINTDEAIRRFRELMGAPSEIVQAKQEVETIRDARAQAIEEAQQVQQAKDASEAVRNVGQSNILGQITPEEAA